MHSLLLLSLLSAGPAKARGGDLLIGAGGGWFLTDPAETIDSTWVIVPRFGYMLADRVGLELDASWFQGRTRVEWIGADGQTEGHYLYQGSAPRLDFLLDFAPNSPVQPFLAVGPGLIWKFVRRDLSVGSDSPPPQGWGQYQNPDTDFLLNAGPGLLLKLGRPVALRADLRYALNLGSEPHGTRSDVFSDWELTGGLQFLIGTRPLDTDGDGLLDKVDACPKEPEDFDRFQDDDGCPDEDNDRDGIADWDDGCPNRAEDFDRFQDDDGCPDPDNDGDGIADADDRCPVTPEDRDGFQDDDGCPDPDNDGDGITDLQDACPGQPEDADAFEDDDGCPDPDNDGDAIADYRDECPLEPETYNGFQDEDGCPDTLPKEVQRFTGVIRGINFEYDRARITVESYPILDQAADVLQRWPEIRLEVQGHTDSDGSEDYNLGLSQRRAQAVVDYLVNRGIDPSRIEAVGYGESRPLVPNDSDEQKAVNRRVEFHVIHEAGPE